MLHIKTRLVYSHGTFLKVIFMQRVGILSATTKSKKIEVKGGFFNGEDRTNELGYRPFSG